MCSGDEAALALLGGATFLETYALSANGADILSYVAQSDGCRKLSLIVQDLNASAENFYRRFGFEIVHVEPCRVGSTDYVVSVMQLSL
ncbi:MAG: GNAT family N-acetyltransferase [Ewingella americana]|jgi:hypothetical protein|uniref:GNAT family N-acetyltransferase n=1 Tax=Ewingella americana TaxID=41202 RepID=UPI00242E98A1|nr:hypothetical protein [Ewingella americana]MCI1678293.1 GNAT family N-acetyltransferase [Ewingella americana]MCI1856070.1 GNAT family N-acetyltransferase [Ewingella americana]MCI1862295.1 GNAT family N-acetyltransferase [Ewingella americana]MCI2142752.1 GNAT family N-acetyltransferase [Ewingella americana]MCI2162543.1 GNAT family N-acetyltransferase [Ewingella americana]